MSDDGVLKFLRMVADRLGARDARLEIGGEPSDDACSLWAAAGASRRVMVIFDEPPEERERRQQHLEALLAAFQTTAQTAGPATTEKEPPQRQAPLDAELAGLCHRAGAAGALIIDGSSPVLWGKSCDALGGDVDALIEASEALVAEQLDGEELLVRLCARAVEQVRDLLERDPSAAASLRQISRGGASSWMARSLGTGYVLLLAFEGGLSEPRAEGAVKRALSYLERLVASLPPIEPPPRRARVVALKQR